MLCTTRNIVQFKDYTSESALRRTLQWNVRNGAFRNFNAHGTISKGRDDEIKVVQRGIRSVLSDIYRCHDKGLKVITSNSYVGGLNRLSYLNVLI